MLASGALLRVQAGGDGAAGGLWMRHGAAGLGKEVAFDVRRAGSAAELGGCWLGGGGIAPRNGEQFGWSLGLAWKT